MHIAEWILILGTAAIGITALWGAIWNVDSIFSLDKLVHLQRIAGRNRARLIVASIGLGLLAMALSLLLFPPT